MNNSHRNLLALVAVGSGMATIRRLLPGPDAHGAEHYEVTHTDAEWRKLLSPAQYYVLREASTEAPFSSPLDKEKRAGEFTCAGCALPLFRPKPNLTAAPAGRASGNRWRMPFGPTPIPRSA